MFQRPKLKSNNWALGIDLKDWQLLVRIEKYWFPTTRALAILEPAMIVGLAFVVGFIVIAVMLPILQTSTDIG